MKFRVAFDPVQRLLAVSILGLLAVFATFRADALPIRNGGFESGGLGFWSTYAAFAGGVTSAEAYGGSYSLELYPGDMVWQDLATPRRFGRLVFYAKAADPDSGSITAYATVAYESTGWLSQLNFGTSLVSDEWIEFELTLESLPRVATVYFSVKDSDAPIYIDRIALMD